MLQQIRNPDSERDASRETDIGKDAPLSHSYHLPPGKKRNETGAVGRN